MIAQKHISKRQNTKFSFKDQRIDIIYEIYYAATQQLESYSRQSIDILGIKEPKEKGKKTTFFQLRLAAIPMYFLACIWAHPEVSNS